MKEHIPNAIALGVVATPAIYSLIGETDLNYLIALGIVVITSRMGTVAPDLDLDYKLYKGRKNIIKRCISRVFNWIGCTHRSWQTHCITVTPLPCIILLTSLLKLEVKGINEVIYLWGIIGFLIGLFSHLLLDAMTKDGIHIVPNVRLKLFGKDGGFVTGETVTIQGNFLTPDKVVKNHSTFFIRTLNVMLLIVGVVHNISYIIH
jgi:membrane-bound metal-dependent hydrolase YbcI (DUF457 family)